jgi:hypothetical protein
MTFMRGKVLLGITLTIFLLLFGFYELINSTRGRMPRIDDE